MAVVYGSWHDCDSEFLQSFWGVAGLPILADQPIRQEQRI